MTVLFKRAKHERLLAFVQLADELQSGAEVEMLPGELIREITAAPDYSLISRYSYFIAYGWAYYNKDNVAAAQFLENCLAFSRALTPKLRGAAIGDAAIFQAERRGNIALAEQWLADLPELEDTKIYRVQAEGAIFEARGSFTAALERIAECVESAKAITDEKVKQRRLKRLDCWRQEVKDKLLKEQPMNPGIAGA